MPTQQQKAKRKKQTPRIRRDPYSRALEQAETRLNKAMEDRVKYATKLQELDAEIPRLQAMIAGIQRYYGLDKAGFNGLTHEGKEVRTFDQFTPKAVAGIYDEKRVQEILGQHNAQDLGRFINPRPDDEDAFLKDDEKGTDLLT